MVPATGARIVSLRSSGREGTHEWLAATSFPDLSRRPADSDPFTRPGMGGWDEVVPTIAPARLPDGTALADHGEAWRRPWTVLTADPGRIQTSLTLSSLPLVMSRTITPVQDGFRLDYQVRCSPQAAGPVPLHWTAHPQFSARPGSVVRLQDEHDHAIVHYPARDQVTLKHNDVLAELTPGSAIKAFLPPDDRCSGAVLIDPDGQRLEMRWDPGRTPYLGLWWDNAGFAEIPVIGIEPSTGYGDDAAETLAAGQLLWLAPGAGHSWWLEVRFPRGSPIHRAVGIA